MGEAIELIELPDRYVLRVNGLTVDACRIGYSFDMETTSVDGENITVRLLGLFSYEMAGNLMQVSSEDPSTLGPVLLAILHRQIHSIAMWKNGRLEMMFDDAGRIVAEPDMDYEAWELLGPSGLLAVCIPGGELAIWR